MAVLAGHFPQTSQVVIPAKAGIHVEQSFDGWVPACAGTTALAFSALLVGAVVQNEILERKYDTGPAHLDSQLAYPEGLRRGSFAVGFALLGLYWMAGDSAAYLWLTAFFCSAWAGFGVYRTVLAARTPPAAKDMM